jgi:transposase-like protein
MPSFDHNSIPKLANLPFQSTESTMEFLVREGVLPNIDHVICPNCQRVGMRFKGTSYKTMRCPNSNCHLNGNRNSRWTGSIVAGTFFAQSRMQVDEIMRILYKWIIRATPTMVLIELGHSSETVSDYFNFCWELVSTDLRSNGGIEIIGGRGIEVEIDESKFAKRKYNRGHRVGDKSWVFGGIQCGTKNFFAAVVGERTRAALLPIIEAHIAPGSIIISDGWKAYQRMNEYIEGADYDHRVVNHSQNFVDPTTGAHTNSIEAKWGSLKRVIPRNTRREEKIQPYLDTEMWRCRHISTLWASLLDALKNVPYGECPFQVVDDDSSTSSDSSTEDEDSEDDDMQVEAV